MKLLPQQVKKLGYEVYQPNELVLRLIQNAEKIVKAIEIHEKENIPLHEAYKRLGEYYTLDLLKASIKQCMELR